MATATAEASVSYSDHDNNSISMSLPSMNIAKSTPTNPKNKRQPKNINKLPPVNPIMQMKAKSEIAKLPSHSSIDSRKNISLAGARRASKKGKMRKRRQSKAKAKSSRNRSKTMVGNAHKYKNRNKRTNTVTEAPKVIAPKPPSITHPKSAKFHTHHGQVDIGNPHPINSYEHINLCIKVFLI